MYKVKTFKKTEVFVDKNGEKHIILVYGELTKTNHLNGVMVSKVKYVAGDRRIIDFENEPMIINSTDSYSSLKEFNFGWAICDPRDKFDEAKGIEFCKKRFGRTPLSTQEGKFLTDDMIEAILANEIEFLKNEKLIPSISKSSYNKVEVDENISKATKGGLRNVANSVTEEAHNSNERRGTFKDGDILRLIWKNNQVSYAAYHSVDGVKKTVTFYWLVSSSEHGVHFVCPLTESVNEFLSVEKAKRSEILEIESLIKERFNKRWNWKEKRLEIKEPTKRRSIIDFFC